MIELLTQLQDLFSDPNRWTTDYYAVDKEGKPTGDFGVPAEGCKYCAVGGISHVLQLTVGRAVQSQLYETLQAKMRLLTNSVQDIEFINDTCGYDLLTKAISECIADEETKL